MTRDQLGVPILANLLTNVLETFAQPTARAPGSGLSALGGLGTRVRVENRYAQLKMNVLSGNHPP